MTTPPSVPDELAGVSPGSSCLHVQVRLGKVKLPPDTDGQLIHSVFVMVGRCMTGPFSLAASVTVDGVLTMVGGLEREDVPKFIADVTAVANATYRNVLVTGHTDASGRVYVVPCPPTQPNVIT